MRPGPTPKPLSLTERLAQHTADVVSGTVRLTGPIARPIARIAEIPGRIALGVERNKSGHIIAAAGHRIADYGNSFLGIMWRNKAYYLAGVEKFEQAPSLATVGKAIAFSGFILFLGKSGLTAHPTHGVSVIDDGIDTLAGFSGGLLNGQIVLESKYWEGFFEDPACTTLAKQEKSKKEADPNYEPIEIVPGENCYPTGGNYTIEASQDPSKAQLGGDVFDDMPASQIALFTALLAAGLSLTFLIRHREEIWAFHQTNLELKELLEDPHNNADAIIKLREKLTEQFKSVSKGGAKYAGALVVSLAVIDFGVSRDVALLVMSGVMGYLGLRVAYGEYGDVMPQYRRADMTEEELKLSRNKLIGVLGLYVAVWAVWNALSFSKGGAQFAPGMGPSVLDDWTLMNWKTNLPLLVTQTFGLVYGAPLFARISNLTIGATMVAYDALSFLAHKDKDNDGFWSFMRHFVRELERSDDKPGYLSINKNVQRFSETELQDIKDGKLRENEGLGVSALAAIPIAGGAYVLYNAFSPAKDAAINLMSGMDAFASTGDALWVGGAIVTIGIGALAYFAKPARFTNGASVAAVTASGLGLMSLGYNSASDLITDFSTLGFPTSPFVDPIAVTGGVVAAAIGVTTMVSIARQNVDGTLTYRRFVSISSHLFSDDGRSLFWSIYTVVVGAGGITNNFIFEYLKGLDLTPKYKVQVVTSAVLNPWSNRFNDAIWGAFLRIPLYRGIFYLPGQLTILGFLLAQGMTEQFAPRYADAYAPIAAMSSSDTIRDYFTQDLLQIRKALVDTIANNGYDDEFSEERLRRAKNQLTELDVILTANNIHFDDGSSDARDVIDAAEFMGESGSHQDENSNPNDTEEDQ